MFEQLADQLGQVIKKADLALIDKLHKLCGLLLQPNSLCLINFDYLVV
jgi:hypothetical protein